MAYFFWQYPDFILSLDPVGTQEHKKKGLRRIFKKSLIHPDQRYIFHHSIPGNDRIESCE